MHIFNVVFTKSSIGSGEALLPNNAYPKLWTVLYYFQFLNIYCLFLVIINIIFFIGLIICNNSFCTTT